MTELEREEARTALYQAQNLVEELGGKISQLEGQKAELEDAILDARRLICQLDDDLIPRLQHALQQDA